MSSEAHKPTKIPHGTRVEVKAVWLGDHWDVDVYLDDESVGGGTTPSYPIDLASDVLYGDKDDWLNGDHGPLGNLER